MVTFEREVVSVYLCEFGVVRLYSVGQFHLTLSPSTVTVEIIEQDRCQKERDGPSCTLRNGRRKGDRTNRTKKRRGGKGRGRGEERKEGKKEERGRTKERKDRIVIRGGIGDLKTGP